MSLENYYDGATDALSEAEGEIKAAWNLTPIKRSDFVAERDFWREVALEAVQALRESYVRDQKTMREYETKRGEKA